VRERYAARIWAGWSDRCECRRGARADFGGARKKKGGNRPGKGVWFGLIAAHCFKEERERRTGHWIGLKTVGGAGDSLGCVAVARLRWPNVARGGEDSRGSTGGGERGGATRGRAAQSCRVAHMAGQRRRRAAEEKQKGDRDWGR
jgi:hypothetical protein